jgi:hypothetical protein
MGGTGVPYGRRDPVRGLDGPSACSGRVRLAGAFPLSQNGPTAFGVPLFHHEHRGE